MCCPFFLGTATISPVPSTVLNLFVSPSTINQSTSLTNTGHSMSPDPNEGLGAGQSTFLYTYLMDYSVCSECACFICRDYSYSGGGGDSDRGGVSMCAYTSRSSHCSCGTEAYQEIKYVHTYMYITVCNFTRCVTFVTGGVCSLLPVSLPVILHDRMLTTCTILC